MAGKRTPQDTDGEQPAQGDGPREYSIDGLAQHSGVSVRNIRAYQDRGILPPPERRGRRGIYSDVHRARLKLIQSLLDRGYSIANISELLEAEAQGQSLTGLLGLTTAIGSPWSDEAPGYYSMTDLAKLFGKMPDPLSMAKAAKLGVLVPEGTRFRSYSPRMVLAGSELVKNGVPFSELLDIVMMLRDNVERVAELFVLVIERRVFGQWGDGKLPPDDEMPRIAELIWRLRPLAGMAVNAEFARAIERAADTHFGDRAAAVLDHMANRDSDSA